MQTSEPATSSSQKARIPNRAQHADRAGKYEEQETPLPKTTIHQYLHRSPAHEGEGCNNVDFAKDTGQEEDYG
jgi:hypothetical protein